MSFEREPMLKTSDDPTGTKTVRGKDLEGKTQTLVKTLSQQLQLCQTFLPDDDERYSNTIELYDAIPKYFTNPRAMEGMRQDGKYGSVPITCESHFRSLPQRLGWHTKTEQLIRCPDVVG